MLPMLTNKDNKVLVELLLQQYQVILRRQGQGPHACL